MALDDTSVWSMLDVKVLTLIPKSLIEVSPGLRLEYLNPNCSKLYYDGTWRLITLEPSWTELSAEWEVKLVAPMQINLRRRLASLNPCDYDGLRSYVEGPQESLHNLGTTLRASAIAEPPDI